MCGFLVASLLIEFVLASGAPTLSVKEREAAQAVFIGRRGVSGAAKPLGVNAGALAVRVDCAGAGLRIWLGDLAQLAD